MANAKNNNNKKEGIIIGIQGPVVDVRFESHPPVVNEALTIETKDKKELVLEAAFLLGDNEARTLALGPTDGLSRGMKVKRTFSPIKVPVGPKTLGRIFNVLGQPVDGGKAIEQNGRHYQ